MLGQTTSFCQPAPDASSSKTICPTENPVALATWTDLAPAAASAVRVVVVLKPLNHRLGPTTMIGDGLALGASLFSLAPFVLWSLVASGSASRRVTPRPSWTKLPSDR